MHAIYFYGNRKVHIIEVAHASACAKLSCMNSIDKLLVVKNPVLCSIVIIRPTLLRVVLRH